MNLTAHNSESKAPVNIAVIEACVIGLAAALGAVALKWGVGFVGSYRVAVAEEYTNSLPLIGLVGGLISGIFVQFFAPTTAGSGIPLTKAALSGLPIRLDLTTAFVKLAGGVAALGSGLALGREGPTVQIAAAVASKFSGWLKTSPTHRIQLIAAGAGAGLAAAFNAPLAGVLFVLEELLKKMSGLAVGTTLVACFVAAVTSRLVGVHSLDINLSEFPRATFHFIDIPFLILLGAVAGLSAALFNKSILAALSFNRDIIKLPISLSCGLAGLITGLVIVHLPQLYWNYAGLRALIMQSGTDQNVIVTALVTQFGLTVLAYAFNAPGGLFAPSLTLGACLGHLIALLEMHLINSGDPGTMAVVGMGAFFCAVARVPMTAVVIVFEMTQDFNVVLPLMVCCMVSYVVAERLDPGSLYDRLLVWAGLELKEETESETLNGLRASRFMTRAVKSIPADATFAKVKSVFEEYSHQGFPVVDEQNRVVGIIAHADLKILIRRNIKPDALAKRFMTPNPITVSSDESLTGVLHLMEKYKVSRIPVIERDKLVGIITRKDIISAESSALGIRTTSGSKSYPVYQTRSPEAGSGRMLVAIGDPKVASSLVRIAAQLAKIRNFELECLHVITVPLDKSPSSANVHTSSGRELVGRCELIGQELSVPIHTSIRVAHDVASAISETIQDRNVNTFVMRYMGSKKSFKSDVLIQSILSTSNCDVILISKLYQQERFCHYLVPVADFLDEELPTKFCINMRSPKDSSITLLRIIHPKHAASTDTVDQRLADMRSQFEKAGYTNIESTELSANSPAGILSQLKELTADDVIVMGLPRKYLAKSINKGLFKKYLNRSANRCAIVITTKSNDAETNRH